ncbi:S24 family peptidase [Silvimonas soli]|uniref:S24 family peptidase n=1 Tax=Silvimonas soli TaxID=2980100 RepID=UPI0024B32B64|nr:S24 family peptidase [Silvimonas soli]
MSSLSERLRLALKSAAERRPTERINQAWLSRQVGISSAGITKWFNDGTRSLEGENLIKAAAALGVSAAWLASGKGEMLKEDFGPAIQTPFRPVRTINNLDEAEHDIFEVPRYTLKASAGTGQIVFAVDELGQPNYCRAGWAKREGLNPADLFSIVVVGDSMMPTIPEGASVIVHKQSQILSGKVHVICRDGECYVKRLIKQFDGSLLVRSDNQAAYKDVVIPADELDTVHLVGLVVSVSFNI